MLPNFATFPSYMIKGKKTAYKMGDTKKVKGKTWHYCDCPNHKGGVHWHMFPTKECRTRKRWLKKESEARAKLAGNEGEIPDEVDGSGDTTGTEDSTIPDDTDESTSTSGDGNVQALLASAFNMTQDNPTLRDAIAEAINAASNL